MVSDVYTFLPLCSIIACTVLRSTASVLIVCIVESTERALKTFQLLTVDFLSIDMCTSVLTLDALLVSVFPNLDGETFEGFGAQILPTDSVIRAELSRDILLSCSSITATESDIMWSSEGNITFDELTLSELLSGMEKFSGSGSDNTRAFEFQYDYYDEGGTDAPFMPFNASVIFAIISSDAINEGTLSCNSSQSGETVALHFSSGKSTVLIECIRTD